MLGSATHRASVDRELYGISYSEDGHETPFR